VRFTSATGWAVVATVVGCASRSVYVPATNATATVQGRPAAQYSVPPEAPQGDVRIASFGMSSVAPQNQPNQTLRALHLRVVLSDNGATPWTFDTRDQRVDVNNRGEISPAFAAADSGEPPPVVVVEPSRERVVDLLFLLPPDYQKADALPDFDALWRVNTGSGVISERTPFERLVVQTTTYASPVHEEGHATGGNQPAAYWTNPALSYEGLPQGYYDAGVVVHPAAHTGDTAPAHATTRDAGAQ
jgi:hypothetical protein